MSISEAIAAAQSAGQSSALDIHNWLRAETGEQVDSGRSLTLSDIAILIGPVRAGQVLATLKAASAQDTTAALIVTVLTSGGVVQPGNAGVQAVLASLVQGEVLSEQEAGALLAVGQRLQIRANLHGLADAPTPHEIGSRI
jgi:hypothetical protein